MLPTSGGAGNFLQFIEKELIPYMENNYRIDSNDRGLLGYSLGGLFSAWVLSKKPEIFRKYGICSPALFWDDYLAIKSLETQSFRNDKNLFISRTEFEEPFVPEGILKLKEIVKNSEHVTLISAQLDNEIHFSGVPATYMRALRMLYGKESPE
jgi:predicted alpha/beta superfamily hydrolase